MSDSASHAAKQRSKMRWVMLGFVTLMNFFLVGFTNQSFNLLLAPISVELGWEPVQRTAIATAMSAGMVWFIFVAGVLLDKISVKKIIFSSIFLAGILVALRGQAEGFTFFFAIKFLYGVAIAFFIPADAKTVGLWFDKDELPVANGIIMAASPLGFFFGNMFTGRLMAIFGQWQLLYTVLGIGAIIIAVAYLIIGKERKSEDASLTSDILTKENLGVWKNIMGVLKLPLVWIFCLANAFMLGTLHAATILGNYVFQTDPRWGLDLVSSGQLVAFSNVASLTSFVLLPIIIRKFNLAKHYVKLAIVFGFITAIANLIGHVSYIFGVLAFTLAFTGLMAGIVLAAPRILMLRLPEVSGPRAGTAMGAYLTIERLAITLFVTLLGGLISLPGAQMSVMLGVFYQLQLLAPILLIIGVYLMKRKYKNTTQA